VLLLVPRTYSNLKAQFAGKRSIIKICSKDLRQELWNGGSIIYTVIPRATVTLHSSATAYVRCVVTGTTNVLKSEGAVCSSWLCYCRRALKL
jgi:hypothetical protein